MEDSEFQGEAHERVAEQERMQAALETLGTDEGRLEALQYLVKERSDVFERLEEQKEKKAKVLDARYEGSIYPEEDDEDVFYAAQLVLSIHAEEHPVVAKTLALSPGHPAAGWEDAGVLRRSCEKLLRSYDALGRLAKE